MKNTKYALKKIPKNNLQLELWPNQSWKPWIKPRKKNGCRYNSLNEQNLKLELAMQIEF
jgi:hypothetical protein